MKESQRTKRDSKWCRAMKALIAEIDSKEMIVQQWRAGHDDIGV